MIEYIRHIDEYLIYQYSSFSKLVPSDKWGNKKQAEEYLQKYWLSEQEYMSVWKQIQDNIFVQGKSLPDLIYHSGFEIIVLRGGCLLIEKEFMQLQKAMHDVGDNYFVIIQHSQDFTEGEPMFRMKYPVNITWKELISGNYISAVLLEMSYNEYYVFGESGEWGKYAANDYDYPLDIIGFKPELASIFREQFMQPKEEHDEIRGWLPQEYKGILK
jgi:hypothetical protein